MRLRLAHSGGPPWPACWSSVPAASPGPSRCRSDGTPRPAPPRPREPQWLGGNGRRPGPRGKLLLFARPAAPATFTDPSAHPASHVHRTPRPTRTPCAWFYSLRTARQPTFPPACPGGRGLPHSHLSACSSPRWLGRGRGGRASLPTWSGGTTPSHAGGSGGGPSLLNGGGKPSGGVPGTGSALPPPPPHPPPGRDAPPSPLLQELRPVGTLTRPPEAQAGKDFPTVLWAMAQPGQGEAVGHPAALEGPAPQDRLLQLPGDRWS